MGLRRVPVRGRMACVVRDLRRSSLSRRSWTLLMRISHLVVLERETVGGDVWSSIRARVLLSLCGLAWRTGVLLLLLHYVRGSWMLLHVCGRLPLLY